jgi:hypothetical protein
MGPSTRSDDGAGSAKDEKVAPGIVGVPTEKITFRKNKPCGLDMVAKTDIDTGRAYSALQKLLGRRPNSVAVAYTHQHIKGIDAAGMAPAQPFDINSGLGIPTPKGFDEELWRSHLSYFPLGLAFIKTSEVVTEAHLEYYEMFPGRLGLAKLLGDGSIVRMNGFYKIVKSIPRYPNIDSGNFILAKGVKPPEGELSTTCVWSEETGKLITGRGRHCQNEYFGGAH